MNSCLYRCSVTHHRLAPKEHRFQHEIFMFYLDLDEVDAVAQKISGFSHNRRNFYSFFDADHEPAGPGPLKERVLAYVGSQGVTVPPGSQVRLLTLPRVAGYIFNPISVFYCFDPAGQPLGMVVEVGNTFREMKLYFVPAGIPGESGMFRLVTPKHFYVSPFSRLDLSFDFQLRLPDEKLLLRVDDHEGADRVLLSTLSGRRAELTGANLLRLTFWCPLVALKVMFLIHWHALLLWRKRVPFHRKAAAPELQRDVLRPHPTLAVKTK